VFMKTPVKNHEKKSFHFILTRLQMSLALGAFTFTVPQGTYPQEG
jgi:hypothetical protein